MKPTRRLRTFNLIALTVIVGFTAGIVLNRALRTIRTPQEKPVAQLIRDLQRQDSTLNDLWKNLWMILPDAVTTSFPSLTPNSAVTIRREAAEELSRRGSEAQKAVPTLATALMDSDFGVRMAAVQALAHLGSLAEPAVLHLINFFKNPTNNKPTLDSGSGQALLALARIAPRDPRVIALTCEALQSQTSPGGFPPSQLPSFAVDSLAIIAQSTNSVITVLIAELWKSGINFDDILANLRRYPAPFNPPLAGNQGTPLPDRNQDPAAPSQDELAALQKKFQKQYDQITLSTHIISALGKIGPKTPDVIPAIVAALKSRHSGICQAAVDALGNMGATAAETVPVLLEVLAETQKPNSASAPTAASNSPGATMAATELRWSPNPPSANSPAPPVVLNNAVKMQTAMLRRYGLPPSTPGPFGLRPRIIQTLGKIGPAATAALPALTAECQDRTSPWRYDAAIARRHIDGRTDEARAVLREGLRNESSWARRKAVVELLAQLGAEALPELIEALTNLEMQVRGVSITALGELGPAARPSVPMLEQALSDRKATIRLAAKRALQRIQPDHPALLSSNSPPTNLPQSAR